MTCWCCFPSEKNGGTKFVGKRADLFRLVVNRNAFSHLPVPQSLQGKLEKLYMTCYKSEATSLRCPFPRLLHSSPNLFYATHQDLLAFNLAKFMLFSNLFKMKFCAEVVLLASSLPWFSFYLHFLCLKTCLVIPVSPLRTAVLQYTAFSSLL